MLVWAAVACRGSEPLRLVETIPLPGVEGRIDHMAIDQDGGRLFIAALGSNSLEVVDLAAGKVERSIGGLREPQGVAFLKDRDLVAVANGDDGECRLFDAKSFAASGAIGFASDADNVRYDQARQRLYVGFGDGGLGVIDTAGLKRLDDIKLPSHPESFQLETSGSRIFVNLPKSRQIAVIDRDKAAMATTWPVDTAEGNFPMALDEGGRRLFVGCRGPADVLVYDTDTGRIVTRFATVGDADDLFYDDRARRLYASGGEGFLAVYQRADGDHFTQLAKLPTAAGARTSLFSPGAERIYVAVPHRRNQAAELRVFEVVRDRADGATK